MSGWPAWFGWTGLKSLWAGPPVPGSREAAVEQDRVGALLNKELRKPPGERDEELVHTLSVDFRKLHLENHQVFADDCARIASALEQPGAKECCAATGWARQRLAAHYRALHYYCQYFQQATEKLSAAEERRLAALLAQATLCLDLPEALQQPPHRCDMCSACAERIQKAELRELQYAARAQSLQAQFLQAKGLEPPPATATAAPRLSTAAAAAAVPPVGEGQQGRQQQRFGGSRSSGGKEDAP